LRRAGAGVAALAVSSLIGWGFILGLWHDGPPRPQPIVIMAKIMDVAIKLRERPSFTALAPLRRPSTVTAPLPEFAVAAPSNRIVAAPSPPKETPPDRARPGPQTAPPPPNYLSLLLSHLNAYKHYPYNARLHHQEGTVRLEFSMDRAGNVLSYRVVGSSGFAELDEAARAMIRDAQPLPPVPASYPGTTLDLVLPLVFSLR